MKSDKRHRTIALRNLLTRALKQYVTRAPEPDISNAAEVEVSAADEMDIATELEQKFTDMHLKERRWAKVAAIDAALQRLQLGQYGLCEECGNEITLERLEAVPFSSYCVDCQHEIESSAHLKANISEAAFGDISESESTANPEDAVFQSDCDFKARQHGHPKRRPIPRTRSALQKVGECS